MIDLHCHLLPCVDDGPETLEEAVAMCRRAAADGITTLVATPHQRHELFESVEVAVLERALGALRGAVGDVPRLLLGAEVRVDSELLADLESAGRGGVLAVAGSRYLLLEPGPYPGHLDLAELVHELRVAGWRPIVAHPERMPYLASSPGLLEALVRRGALLQVTAGSLEGCFGRKPQACAELLLDRGLAHLVASDAHDAVTRPPLLGPTRDRIASRWGAAVATRLLETNPLAVVEDREPGGGW